MKNLILVGIDFSKGSLGALDYAVTIASKTGAKVLMVWVDKVNHTATAFNTPKTGYKSEIKKQLEALVKKHTKKLKGKIDYKIRTGKVYQEISNQAKYSDADLIVGGTHGTSGFQKFWIGSNANRIVSIAPCPVITIRAGFKFKKKEGIQKIVLPIDSTQETREKVSHALRLALNFSAEIHVIALHTTSIKTINLKVDSYANQVRKFIDDKDNGIKVVLKSIKTDNITSATLKYVEENNADMIAIMTEQETSTANIVLGPYAQQMVNHSPVPVLSIHSKGSYDIEM
jgi:nucleotide-binding universal stress UspA family protein